MAKTWAIWGTLTLQFSEPQPGSEIANFGKSLFRQTVEQRDGTINHTGNYELNCKHWDIFCAQRLERMDYETRFGNSNCDDKRL